jgi:hypothetical protein
VTRRKRRRGVRLLSAIVFIVALIVAFMNIDLSTPPAASNVATDSSSLPQSPGTSSPPALPPLQESQLNELWWEIERSSSTIADEFGAKHSEKGSLSDEEFMAKIEKSLRAPIAQKWGISYEELQAVFDAGETAAWRTSKPPSTDLTEPVAHPSELVQPEVKDRPSSSGSEVAPTNPNLRTWQDASGQFTVEAEFAGYGVGIVTLKKPDGSMIKVPLDQLSEDDQKWVRGRGK